MVLRMCVCVYTRAERTSVQLISELDPCFIDLDFSFFINLD